jgi:Zn-finger nucleic acid-binding protein
MKCPKCKTPELLPTMIEEYLPAMGCSQCHGSLLSLLHYRHWAETQKNVPEPLAKPGAIETDDTSAALSCPKCSRFMMKYKVTGSVANRLDVCGFCDEAWLDRGEWELLEALQLSHRMPAIFTEQWQRRIRHELSEETRRSILERTIGAVGAAKVEAFRAWLSEIGHRSEILTYLYRK